ncbi:MAG: extracellular solute-binding protein [Clostridia bacterium]|nr:extracellular solute-binding protein [Clostridia bacterium]
MKKRICSVCSVLLAIVMTALLFTGCNGKKSNAIVIHAGVVENAVVDYDDMAFWDDVEKATGVRFELEEMSTEKISLMFTSGDYVDVMFGGGFTDSQIQIAANSGDVVEITDEMLATYAPTWKKAFDENPDYYNAAKFDGGKLYSLPYIRTLEADRGVRDVWWINKVWLDELNLSMPKTLNDFVNILRAFKNNAGKGSIPENVMPWYFCANSIIGGQFDFLATYGLEAYDYTYMALNDEGKVINYATDTRLKSAVAQMASMYNEGLIAPESFTESGTQYTSRVNTKTDTPYIGVFTAYWCPNDEYVPMTLFTAQSNTKPLIRQQPLGVVRNRTVIFNSCEYPEKVLEALEWIAGEKATIYNEFGKEGDGWDYDESTDTYTVHVAKESNVTPSNAISGLLDDRFSGRIRFDEDHAWAKRASAIELYKDNRIPLSHILPPLSFSASVQEQADNYKTTICQRYISSKMNAWITGADSVTAQWDDYVSQVKTLGMDKYIALYQEAYDNFKN